MDFYYIKEFHWNYYMPIYKMDIFLWSKIINNPRVVVWFLENIYECFDGLAEKEYLLDTDKNIYYSNGLFSKKYPTHQFSDLNIIQHKFEKDSWLRLFETFIMKFSKNNFVLDIENSWEYHKIHSIVLYYIYLVYIMYKNIADSTRQLEKLETLDFWVNEAQKELAKERLSYVNDLNKVNFQNYYQQLETFFNLFK